MGGENVSKLPADITSVEYRLRRSPSIWMMLLSLEARLENKATGHNLVYQATAACPWVKGTHALSISADNSI